MRSLLWVLPWIIGLLLFSVLPMGISFYFSLTDYTMLEPALWVGLENYRALLVDEVFWKAVRNTAV